MGVQLWELSQVASWVLCNFPVLAHNAKAKLLALMIKSSCGACGNGQFAVGASWNRRRMHGVGRM
jgi:hypothetical protein